MYSIIRKMKYFLEEVMQNASMKRVIFKLALDIGKTNDILVRV